MVTKAASQITEVIIILVVAATAALWVLSSVVVGFVVVKAVCVDATIVVNH